MTILYIRKVILFVSLYSILYNTNACEDKSVTQVCSALLDSYYNQAMGKDEQVFDPALPDFKAKFSIMQPIRRNDFGTIKVLLMKHCFPDTLTIEEKTLRLNIALSHRHLYVFFKQNTVSLYEITEQCLNTKKQQPRETKMAKVVLIYDEKTRGRPLKLVLIPDPNQQPTSFHIFRISLKAEVTDYGFMFYWGHNKLIQNVPFAEIAHDGHNIIFSPFDEIDNRLFSEERSMKYYDKQSLLKLGDMIKINETFTSDARVLYKGQEFKIIKKDKLGSIFVYDINAEKKFAIRIENSYFFHFSTLPGKIMLNNPQFDDTSLHEKNVKTDEKNVQLNLALKNDNNFYDQDKFIKTEGYKISNFLKPSEQNDNLKYNNQKRFQGFIISIGKTYGFIQIGDAEPKFYFNLFSARYISDTFKVLDVVNFSKETIKGQPRAIDVFKVADIDVRKNNEQRFEGVIRRVGKEYGFIEYGVDGSNIQLIHFHYKHVRYSDDTFRPLDVVSFCKHILNDRSNAVDVFKVQNDKEDTQTLNKQTKDNDEEFFPDLESIFISPRKISKEEKNDD